MATPYREVQKRIADTKHTKKWTLDKDAQTRANRAEMALLRTPVGAEYIPPQTNTLTEIVESELTSSSKQPSGWRIAFAALFGSVLTAGLLGWTWWHWRQTEQINYRFIATSLVAIGGMVLAIALKKNRVAILIGVGVLLIELGIGLLPET